MKIDIDKIIIKCLYLAFIVTSYASYIPSSIVDDIIIIFIGMLLIFKVLKERKLNYKLAISIIIILLQCTFGIISKMEYSNYTISSLESYIKISVLLILTYYINLENEQKNRILKNFVILSIPNLFLGFLQYYQGNIKGVMLLGKYELVSGKYFYRIQGATGHPLYYAFLLDALILYFLYDSKFKFRNIMVLVCIVLCMFTYSSIAIIISILLVIFKILSKKQAIIKMIQKHSRMFIALIIVLSIGFIYKYMLTEMNTIRYVSTISTISNITFDSFLVGRGFGSYLSANYSEAYIFRVIYENGIIGLLPIVVILSDLIVKQIKNSDFRGTFIIYIYILNLFINEGYIVPYILLIPVFCCQNIAEKNNK